MPSEPSVRRAPNAKRRRPHFPPRTAGAQIQRAPQSRARAWRHALLRLAGGTILEAASNEHGRMVCVEQAAQNSPASLCRWLGHGPFDAFSTATRRLYPTQPGGHGCLGMSSPRRCRDLGGRSSVLNILTCASAGGGLPRSALFAWPELYFSAALLLGAPSCPISARPFLFQVGRSARSGRGRAAARRRRRGECGQVHCRRCDLGDASMSVPLMNARLEFEHLRQSPHVRGRGPRQGRRQR